MARRRLRRSVWLLLVVVTACSGRQQAPPTTTSSPPPTAATTITPTTITPTTTPTTAPQAPTTITATTAPPPPTTAASTTTAPTPTTEPGPTAVTTPGDYADASLEIHLTFRSEVDGVATADFAATAMGILTDPNGWARSGFTFVLDEASELTVVLAEPNQVDALCLPLETRGYASCQNGAVVALNAERWRSATGDWDASIDEYRRYLVTHEVGHLIGLRHPQERCPGNLPRSAVMEPQTGGLVCPGNGRPLDWEIEWASNRPAVIGPLPEWDGPRPSWP